MPVPTFNSLHFPTLLTTAKRRDSRNPTVGTPDPESADQLQGTRQVALVILVTTGLYLTWRGLATLNLGEWWVSVPLLLLEFLAGVRLLLACIELWDVDAVPPAVPAKSTKLRLAVLVAAHDQPAETLLSTVAAALAVELPHQTLVLDDHGRPEVERLCGELGATYLPCPVGDIAESAGLNSALARIDADLVAILAVDQVACRGLLCNTISYFDDPGVALVQTPIEIGDPAGSSVARFLSDLGSRGRTRMAGRNRWNTAHFEGSGAVIRSSAVREAGGFSPQRGAADIDTSLRLHRRGWKSVFHDEVLVRRLATPGLAEHLKRAELEASGAAWLLRHENPVLVGGLSPMQRIGYLATLLERVAAWRWLLALLIPVAIVLFAAVPISAPATLFVPLFLGMALVQRYARTRLERDRPHLVLTEALSVAGMSHSLQALTGRLFPSPQAGHASTGNPRPGWREGFGVPVPLWGFLGMTTLTLIWGLSTLRGLTPLHYTTPWIAAGAVVWLFFNCAVLAAAVGLIASQPAGPERRASVRFQVDWAAEVNGAPGRLLDASLSGARVLLPSTAVPPGRGEHVAFRATTGSSTWSFSAVVRSSRGSGGPGTVVGVEFEEGQAQPRAAFALALLRGGAELFVSEGEFPALGAA